MKTLFKNYKQASEYLGKKTRRNVTGKVHTYLEKTGNDMAIALYYHNTAIVTYYPDNTITLNNGGYYTLTTKDRINEFTNIGVYQKNFQWFVSALNSIGQKFYNGITLNNSEVI